MKKILSIVLILTLVFALAACGGEPATKTIASVDDLPGATIGVQMGTTGDIYASDYEADGSVIERYSKGADAVVALTSGKIDCVIIDEQPAKAFVASNEGLMILEEPFELEEYAICAAKGSALVGEFNTALAALTADGTIDKIIANYIGDDTKGKSPYVPSEAAPTKGTLTMATNAFFEPYEYYVGEEIVGIDVDIAKAICDYLGYELVIEDMDFDSIVTAVQSGKADFGAAGLTITEDRLKNIDFTTPYTTATQVIIVPIPAE